MPTAYTSLLGLALPVTGELQGTWGTTVNDAITSLLDTAVAGTTTLSTDADVTLSTTTGAANQARQAIILWTANGTVTRNITAPAQSKVYVVINASAGTQSIVIRGVGPTTGVTVAKGEKVVVAWNGSDFVRVAAYGGTGEFTTVDTTNLEVTNIKAKDGTSAASIANSTGVVSLVANLGVGTTSPVGRVDAVASAYAAFTARSSSSGAGLTVDALKVIDSGGTNFATAAYSATAHIWNYAGASEGMRLNSSGNVGIGTSSPSQKFHVNGATSTYIRVSSTNASTGSGLITSNATNAYIIGAGAASGGSGLEFKDDTNAATRMVLTSGGNLGIGTTTVNAKLHVNGSVTYTVPVDFSGAGANSTWNTGFTSQAISASILASNSIAGVGIYSVSDKRLKENITPLPDMAGLDFVKAVDPVSFDWKSDKSRDTGFIAQSLMSKGYGHLVSTIPDGAMEEVTDDDGNVSPAGARFVVRYDSIVPILHAAIRDQQALIEALMARVAVLEAK